MTEIERTVGQVIAIVQKSVPSVASLTTQTVIVEERPLTRAATVKKVVCVLVCILCQIRLKHSSDLHYVMKMIQIWSTTSMPSSTTAWL